VLKVITMEGLMSASAQADGVSAGSEMMIASAASSSRRSVVTDVEVCPEVAPEINRWDLLRRGGADNG
jgi:hypothetical protein